MANLVVKVTEKGISATKDKLDGLEKSGTKAEKMTTKLAKGMAAVGSASLAAGAAVGAASIQTAKAVVELDNMARVAGLSTSELINLGHAAQQFGMTAEQMSDAFKDAEEKIGEFVTVGTGGFQDFADVVGMSEQEAASFSRQIQQLSGRDALVAMVTEMEKAGASTEQMSWALEGMGSDLTRMIPLLVDGGREAERLEQAMASVTNPLTDEEIEIYRNLNAQVGLLEGAFSSLVTKALIPVAEVATEIAASFAEMFSGLNLKASEELSAVTANLKQQGKLVGDLIMEQERLNVERNKEQSSAYAIAAIEAEQKRNKTELVAALGVMNNLDERRLELEKQITTETEKQAEQKGTGTSAPLDAKLDIGQDSAGDAYMAEIERIDEVKYAYEDYAQARAAAAVMMAEAEVAALQQVEAANAQAASVINATEQMAMQAAQSMMTSVAASSEEGSAIQIAAFLGAQAMAAAASMTNTQVATTMAMAQLGAAAGPVVTAIEAKGQMALGIIAAQTAVGLAGRAQGGDVIGGNPYEIGERGREVFVPTGNGKVMPVDESASGSSSVGTSTTNINFSIQALDSKGVQEVLVQNRALIHNIVQKAQANKGKKF